MKTWGTVDVILMCLMDDILYVILYLIMMKLLMLLGEIMEIKNDLFLTFLWREARRWMQLSLLILYI